jgi:spore coat polysaccharide biosynthesis protein SpsF
VLLPLPTGRSVLAEVVYRARKIHGVDEVVVAVPDGRRDDILAHHVEQLSVRLYRGPEDDVLSRYHGAAVATKADVVMRITADCPLIHPPVCAGVLATFRRPGNGYDYVSNTMPRTFPKGLDCEVFSADLLAFAQSQAVAQPYREHVTLWMLESWNRPNIVIGNYANDVDYSHENWSLDTLDDYCNICNIFGKKEVLV